MQRVPVLGRLIIKAKWQWSSSLRKGKLQAPFLSHWQSTRSCSSGKSAIASGVPVLHDPIGHHSGLHRRQESAPLLTQPDATFDLLAKSGVLKSTRPLRLVFVSSLLGGVFLAFGGALVVSVVGASPALAAAAPGLAKLLGGLLFPVGLTMIVFTGTDLLTSAMVNYVLPHLALPAAVCKDLGSRRVLRLWATTFAGNFLGSAGVAALFASCALSADPLAWAAAATVAKTSMPWGVALAKGAAANFLVNAAVFMAASSQTPGGKIAAIWLPITTFVALGLEHSVANMFLLPLGFFGGADVTASEIMVNNIVPVTLGNFCGALLFLTLYVPRASPGSGGSRARGLASWLFRRPDSEVP